MIFKLLIKKHFLQVVYLKNSQSDVSVYLQNETIPKSWLHHRLNNFPVPFL